MAEKMVCMWGWIAQEFLKQVVIFFFFPKQWRFVFFFMALFLDFRQAGIMTGSGVMLMGHC